MAAYIIGMQKIVSLASQRKRVAAPRAEPMELPSAMTDKSAIRSKDPGSKDFLSSSRMTGKPEVGTARQVCFELDVTVSRKRV
jgi:hypothetical protein